MCGRISEYMEVAGSDIVNAIHKGVIGGGRPKKRDAFWSEKIKEKMG